MRTDPVRICTTGVRTGYGRAAVCVDCRWLGIWGAGRITELLLRGLHEDPPEVPYALWGKPEALAPFVWRGASVIPDGGDPRTWFGQQAWSRIPEAGVVLFGHQRPLRRVPSVTWLFDTIQLRYDAAAVGARRAYLRRLAAVSDAVLTISRHSHASIEADLGVDPRRIAVVTPPVDWERADRVRARREQSAARAPIALFVGRFALHKNLPALVEAFEKTDFRAAGGRLVLVGGAPGEVREVVDSIRPGQEVWVDVRGHTSDEDLDALLAEATLLVQPSLEEGFGLPVAEAMAAGVPVCVSDGGALPEVVGDLATPFPARSVEAMAASIDATAAAPTPADRLVDHARRRFPTVAGFARAVRAVLENAT